MSKHQGRKVADYLISRKLAKNLEDIQTLVAAGDVKILTGQSMGYITVTNPNAIVDPVDLNDDHYPIMLSVNKRGFTKIYKPYFCGEHMTVTRRDYKRFVWEVVERAKAICAVGVLDGKDIVLVRVFRPILGDYLFELPAGMSNSWEAAHDTALRELEEETGYSASRIDRLWSAFSSPGFTTEAVHFYLCTGLTEGRQELDPEEDITVAVIPIADAFDMIGTKIIDMKTIAAISYLKAKSNDCGL